MKFSSKSLLTVTACMALGLGGMAGCGGDDDGTEEVRPGSSSSSGSSGSSSGEETSSSGGSGSSSGGASSSSSGEPGPATELPDVCDGACKEMALTLTRGEQTAAFGHAQFGFYLDGSLHIEHYIGGARECPKDGAPTPQQTLVVTPPFPANDQPIVKGSGMGVGFVDFAGTFGGIPSSKVQDAVLTPQAASFLRDEMAGYFAYDLDIVFEDGMTIEGHAYAEYCESMSELEAP